MVPEIIPAGSFNVILERIPREIPEGSPEKIYEGTC